MPVGCRHGLDARAHDVVERVLRARLQPEVCEWVRSESDLELFGLNWLTRCDQSRRPARILATSMKKFIPTAQKNESRGAKASIERPAATPARMYSTPSASVYASSMSAVAPASCMW